jgi:hypothetical protein
MRRKKQAEILIPVFLDLKQVFGIICFSESAKIEVMKILQSAGIRKLVTENPGWYFNSDATEAL